jgi:hypothetical protein
VRLTDLAFALTILLALPLAEGAIAKSSAWKVVVHQLEIGALRLIQWRANARVRREMAQVGRFLGLCALVAFVLLIAALLLESGAAATAMWWIFAVAFLGWFSFQWTLEHGKYLLDFAKFAGMMIALPWLFYLCQLAIRDLPLVDLAGLPLLTAGFSWSTPLEGAMVQSAFFAGAFGTLWAVGWLLYAPIPLAILSALWLSNRLAVAAARFIQRKHLFDAVITVWIVASVYLYWRSRTP